MNAAASRQRSSSDPNNSPDEISVADSIHSGAFAGLNDRPATRTFVNPLAPIGSSFPQSKAARPIPRPALWKTPK
tara:strand:+ start:832 stop:1056 length:225 start_codon:yes stop_codon:yes gene_type:complete